MFLVQPGEYSIPYEMTEERVASCATCTWIKDGLSRSVKMCLFGLVPWNGYTSNCPAAKTFLEQFIIQYRPTLAGNIMKSLGIPG